MLDRSPGSAKDHIGYNTLTQAAGLAVVRAALQKVAKLGHLPADHHFYVTFRTRTQGVQMADYLKDRFPEEMTIVIQHQYWEFEVHEERFEIILKFNGVPQHIRVPFVAVSRFFDPSVNFGIQFEANEAAVRDFSEMGSLPEIAAGAAPAAQAETPEGETAQGTVVQLDAFRRK